MTQNNMNFTTTNLNKKVKTVRKIYFLKLFTFFIKDPDRDPDPNKSRWDPQHCVRH